MGPPNYVSFSKSSYHEGPTVARPREGLCSSSSKSGLRGLPRPELEVALDFGPGPDCCALLQLAIYVLHGLITYHNPRVYGGTPSRVCVYIYLSLCMYVYV